MQRSAANFLQKSLVLVAIPRCVFAEELTGVCRIWCKPCDRIQLMVSHHRQRRSGIHHAPGDTHRFDLLRATIYKVADKNGLSVRVPPRTLRLAISHLSKQSNKCICTAVYVGDKVVLHEVSYLTKITTGFPVEW